jgi:hypothetical protein
MGLALIFPRSRPHLFWRTFAWRQAPRVLRPGCSRLSAWRGAILLKQLPHFIALSVSSPNAAYVGNHGQCGIAAELMPCRQ